MQAFLQKLAHQLYTTHQESISDLCIVFPSRRASTFFRSYLSEQLFRAVWSPKIYSIEDFICEITGLQKAESAELLFRFYEAYRANEKNPETFDEFLRWGPVLMRDFNEVDAYLIDTNDFFSFVNDVRAIEVWNPDGRPTTEMQEQYLKFWKNSKRFYEHFSTGLLEQKLGYQGLIYRYAAEHISECLPIENGRIANRNWSKIVFAGFNAINKAEETILDYLKKEKLADVFWQADKFYFNDPDKEAGMFLRKWQAKWPSDFEGNLTDHWRKEHKNINYYSVSSDLGQARLANEIVERWNTESTDETALVLADESLLVPVLNSLPANMKPFNITLGYPLSNTPFKGLWDAIFETCSNFKAINGDRGGFYFRPLTKILEHTSWRWNKQARKAFDKVLKHIKKQNLLHVHIGHLRTLEKSNKLKKEEVELVGFLFEPISGKANDVIHRITQVIELLKGGMLQVEEKEVTFLREALFEYTKVFHQLKRQIKNSSFPITINTLRYLMRQLEQMVTIPFFGEPLHGLQIMGTLETRLLDFKKVIITTANEGVIPAGKKGQTFIPFEVRHAFELPSHVEKDAIFAYHFFRLLEQAEEVHLIYNSVKGMDNSGEPSRYIRQLEYELPNENPKAEITYHAVSLDAKKEEKREVEIQKTPEVIAEILNFLTDKKRGLSPSALNTYIDSPLDFYYRYVLKINEAEEVEENIEISTFGTILHQVLEDIYEPFTKKVIQPDGLNSQRQHIEEWTQKAFHDVNMSFQSGKNFLSYKVVIRLLNRYLDLEVARLKDEQANNVYRSMVQKEELLERYIEVEGVQVRIKGFADRVDRVGNTIQVIDYKSGKVNKLDLKITELNQLLGEKPKSKALQLLMYAWMAFPSLHPGQNIASAIVSFRNLNEQLLELDWEKEKVFEVEKMQEFESFLKDVLREMLDIAIPLKNHTYTKYSLFD